MAKPKAVEIRGYNVGFGDCFLLTFDYGKAKKHVLIDFGTTQPPAGEVPSAYMRDVAEAIKTDCGGHLAAIGGTHPHARSTSRLATRTNAQQASRTRNAQVAAE